MPISPPSSMPEPLWFMRQTATLTKRTASQETAGSWELNNSTTYTVQCCLQPSSSSESMLYQRETGRTNYTIYLRTHDINGTALTTTELNRVSSITVDNVTYFVSGEFIDLANNGVVYMVLLYRET
mgnify:CR=1 FL=1